MNWICFDSNATMTQEQANNKAIRLDKAARGIGAVALVLLVATIVLAGIASSGKVSPNVVLYTFIGCGACFIVTKLLDNYLSLHCAKHKIDFQKLSYMRRHPEAKEQEATKKLPLGVPERV